MTSLVEHAERELRYAGTDPALAGALVAAVGALATTSRHAGASAEQCRNLLERLLRFEPLTPLTADPAEWVDVRQVTGTETWQSMRDPQAFSDDVGRTFYRLDEPPSTPPYVSEAPQGWVLALRERDGLSRDAAVAAVFAYLDVGPVTETDRRVLLAVDTGTRERLLAERWGEGAAMARVALNPDAVQVAG